MVLDVKEGQVLLLSNNALDAKAYNDEKIDVSWENCTLRKWLNNDFYETAFYEQE